ncbi:solute carrier family 22 member 7-like [Ascaphus truei]|uniref:solute carrier family 22 member 7-like n=1 Tax=Ascaphus truei TaxID=8439 RepID=UPI003F59F1E4
MRFDDLLLEAGGFGRFQVLTLLLLCIPRLILPLHFLLHNFISAVPPHHCAIPTQGLPENLSQEEQLLVYIPREADGTFSSCKMYSKPQLHLLLNSSQGAANGSRVQSCEQGWDYDNSTFTSTTVTQWDLVCDRKGLNQALATFFFIGVTVGAITIGYLSDRFGRRVMLLLSFLISLVFGGLSAGSVSYPMLAVSRSLCGVGLSGLSIITVALSVEWVGPQHRTFAGILTSLCWSTGNVFLALLGYLLRDWRSLLITVTAPCVLGVISIWWLPESARWLLARGQVQRAQAELVRCAAINSHRSNSSSLSSENIKELAGDGATSANYSYIDLFRTPALRRISLCAAAVWFGVASTYYGISLSITGFGLDIFVTHCLYGLVEFPAKLGVYFLMNGLGRRRTQALTLLVSGISIGVNTVIPTTLGPLRAAVAIIGKGFSEAAFTAVILYTAEMYPTVVRQNGIGYTAFVGRIGVCVAPLVILLDDFWPPLPQVTFCSVAVVCGLVAFLLPETVNVCLPETIGDVERGRSGLQDQNSGTPLKEK